MKSFAGVLFVVFSSFSFSSFALNKSEMVCASRDYTVNLHLVENEIVSYSVEETGRQFNADGYKMDDGTISYSLLVDEAYDTNYWFDIEMKDGKITKREFVISGNDSDNYKGGVDAEGDAAFTCR